MKNGQSSPPHSRPTSATTAQTKNPLNAVANAPTSASRLRRIENPSATDMPPKSTAESSARATPDTVRT